MIGKGVIKEICERCLVMEEFFVAVEPGELVCFVSVSYSIGA
jgi:hypothetical protein